MAAPHSAKDGAGAVDGPYLERGVSCPPPEVQWSALRAKYAGSD